MSRPPDPDAAGALAPAEISVVRSTGLPGWRVVVRGEIDVATSPVLRRQLERLAGDDGPIVVDVHDLTFIDSSGLGVLVDLLERRRAKGGGPVTLEGMQEPVRRVFEITGLTALFDVD